MRKNIRLIVCFILSIVMCFALSSCSNVKKVSDYAIIYDNGEYFILFDDATIYQNNTQQLASINFSSMKEFKDAVTKGTLTDSQKSIMSSSFKKNDDGAILVCDLDNLFIPELPDSGTVSHVGWSGGNNYSFELSFDGEIFGWYHYLIEEQYNELYQSDYVKLFERDNIRVTSREMIDGNKEVIYLSTSAGDFKNVRYTLYHKNKQITVDKRYCLRLNNSNFDASSDVPNNIDLYCTEGDQNYIITLFGFTQDPSDEWLLSFGIQEYND